MSKPISPKEVVDKKAEAIPDFVFDAFNEAIAKNWDGHEAVVLQSEVVKAILKKNPNLRGEEMFDNHWLDVEDVYRKAGWTVGYDKPGYNESYSATFTFKKKKVVMRHG